MEFFKKLKTLKKMEHIDDAVFAKNEEIQYVIIDSSNLIKTELESVGLLYDK